MSSREKRTSVECLRGSWTGCEVTFVARMAMAPIKDTQLATMTQTCPGTFAEGGVNTEGNVRVCALASVKLGQVYAPTALSNGEGISSNPVD